MRLFVNFVVGIAKSALFSARAVPTDRMDIKHIIMMKEEINARIGAFRDAMRAAGAPVSSGSRSVTRP